jgi:hypothetical protein
MSGGRSLEKEAVGGDVQDARRGEFQQGLLGSERAQ